MAGAFSHQPARTHRVALLSLLVLAASCSTFGQNTQEKAAATPQTDPAAALEFLGSYSAPTAILATETGHTSAHPPSPAVEQRIRQIGSELSTLPPWPNALAWAPADLEAGCKKRQKVPQGGSKWQMVPQSGMEQNPGVAEGNGSTDSRVANSKGPRTTDQGQTDNWPQLADGALREGLYGEASLIYARALESHPGCGRLLWNSALAGAYAQSSNALADVTAAFPEAPSAEIGHYVLGLVRLGHGDPEGARRELEDAERPKANGQWPAGRVDQAPNGNGQRTTDYGRLNLLWSQAMLARAANTPAEARRSLCRILGDHPDLDAVWFELGTTALEEARAYSRRLSEVAPASDWNRRMESAALRVRYPALAGGNGRGESEGGSQEPGAGSQRSVGTNQQEALPGAGPVDAELQKLEGLPESPEVLYRRAREALELSKIAYFRASRSPRFDARLCALQALAAEEEHDEAAAIAEYRNGLERHPQSAILHAGLGHLDWHRQDFQAARLELGEAARLNPSDPIVTFELGDTYRRLGQPSRALELLNRALELDPGLLLARWSRGRAYIALGDDQQALADLEGAATVDSTGELQWQLAGLYRKLGYQQQAEQAEQLSQAQRAAHNRE